MAEECLTDRLFRLKLEMLGSNPGTEAQISVADKRGVLVVCTNTVTDYGDSLP